MSNEKPNNLKRVKVLATDQANKRLLIEDDQGNIGVSGAAEDGKPINPHDDIVQFQHTDDPTLLDMRTLYKGRPKDAKGPAKVATKKYRSGWDAIFGAKRQENKTLN